LRIVIAEKDVCLAEFIKEQLESESYEVDLALDHADLVSKLESKPYDLAMLAPEPPQLDVIRKVRQIHPHLLLVVFSDKKDRETQLVCLDAGADDFVTKPFSMSVLRARLRVLWRRRNKISSGVLEIEGLELNQIRRTVKRNGCPVDLTQKEFALLEFLMERPMQPVSRAVIAENAWHIADGNVATNTVDVYVNYIRKKLGSYGDRPLIRTVRGIGYQIGGADVPRKRHPSPTD
jgi:DNA-binding response OmpR family regulator